jgi:hypothetical protein
VAAQAASRVLVLGAGCTHIDCEAELAVVLKDVDVNAADCTDSPALAVASLSSVVGGCGDPKHLVKHTHAYPVHNETRCVANSWMAVDVGAGQLLAAEHYALRKEMQNTYAPRYWGNCRGGWTSGWRGRHCDRTRTTKAVLQDQAAKWMWTWQHGRRTHRRHVRVRLLSFPHSLDGGEENVQAAPTAFWAQGGDRAVRHFAD